MDPEHRARLQEIGVDLPTVSPPNHNYAPTVLAQGVMYVSGKVPCPDFPTRGQLGDDVDTETGYLAARSAAAHCLAQLESDLGLEHVQQIVKITGFVASATDFHEQPQVINGASDLFTHVLGARGEHARSAIGVAALPGNWPVEIEITVLTDGS